MQTSLPIKPYPWNALDTVAREAAWALRDARRAVRRAVDETKIAQALSELLGEHVSVLVTEVEVTSGEVVAMQGATLSLATPDDTVQIQLEVERDLARTLVARIIGRSARSSDPGVPLAPEIEGGLLAIVCSVARRAHGPREVLRPIGPGALRAAPGERRVKVDATLFLGADAYAVGATIQLRGLFAAYRGQPKAELASLGELPISLPMIGAASVAKASEIYGISRDDVWLPGDGWTIQRSVPRGEMPKALTGEVILAAPGAERGIEGTLGENGQIVVLGVTGVPQDAEARAMSGDQDDSTATSEVALEAPLVVRVEIGAVTLTAREWAALRPGDVIALGRRVSEPVVLRVAGLEVARGELVDIEGEIGVRIRDQVKTS